MSFRQRLLFILLGLAVAPLLLALLIAIPAARQSITRDKLAEMDVIATLKTVQLAEWLAEGQRVAFLVADWPETEDYAGLLHASPNTTAQVEGQRAFISKIAMYVGEYNFIQSISVVNAASGEVVLSTDTRLMGRNWSDKPFLTLGPKRDNNIGVSIESGEGAPPVVFLSTPVWGDDGAVIGAVVIQMEISHLQEILSNTSGLGAGGRVYLVDPNDVHIALSSDGPEMLRPTTTESEGIRRARAGGSGSATYQTNTGDTVLGAYRWLPYGKLGLAIEMNQSELNTRLLPVSLSLLGLILVLIAVVVPAARYLSSRLADPMERIALAAQTVRAGNLAYRAPRSGLPEADQLALAFNEMAGTLQQSQQELARQVKARTAELTKTNQQLHREIAERAKTAAKLQESEERFRLAFYTNPDAIVISALDDGHIVDVNEGFTVTTGYTRAEAISKTSAKINIWHNPADRARLVQGLQETGYVENLEARFRRKDGSIITGLMSARLISINGEMCTISVTRDISDWKAMQRAVKENEARYRSLFEDSPISLWEEDFSAVKRKLGDLAAAGVIDLQAYFKAHPKLMRDCIRLIKVIDVNQATVSLFRADTKAKLLDDLNVIFPAGALSTFAAEFAALFAGATHFQGEQIHQTLSGRLLHTIIRLSIAPGYEETWGKVFVSVLDVTETRQVERALARSEARYRQLAETAQDVILTHDMTGRITYVNNAGIVFSGYSREQILKMNVQDLISETHQQNIAARGRQQKKGNTCVYLYEVEMKHASGHLIPMEVSSSPLLQDGEITGVLAMGRDITRRKQREAEIQRRNQELTLLNRVIAASAFNLEPEVMLETVCREVALALEVPHVAAILLDEQKTIATIAAEFAVATQTTLLGQTVEVRRSRLAQYLLVQKAPLVIDDIQQERRIDPPLRALFKQVNLASLLLLPMVIEDMLVGALALGTVEAHHFLPEEISLSWSVADQVAGVLARTRLNQTQQRLLTAIEQLNESVIITDIEDNIIYVNRAFEEVTGYSRAETLGRKPDILYSGYHDVAFLQEIWETINAGQVWHGRIVNKKKNGGLFTEDAVVTPLTDKKGQIVNFITVKRDVTQELEQEKQYRQAQKMEAIGRLTGGIAHDFNNILTAVNGFAELLQRRLEKDDPRRNLVDSILKSGQRAADLTKQLLVFSRKDASEARAISLNAIIVDMHKILTHVIGETIEVETHLADNLDKVKIDPTQVEQVVMNLAVNARDAMPDGGRLVISTGNVYLDEENAARFVDLSAGEYVLLTVADTGVGMSDEVQAHLFEPFFTTKERGKGTGLGLATSYGIITQNGGHISVESRVGAGATFYIYLPATDVEDRLVVKVNGDETAMPVGTETILLAEDEEPLRRMIGEVLRQQGFTVLEASNGQQGLQVACAHKGRIDLLLTDVIMPVMNGKLLARQLLAERANMKVLYMSGYTDDVLGEQEMLLPSVAFLKKPFRLPVLLQKIRNILDIELKRV